MSGPITTEEVRTWFSGLKNSNTAMEFIHEHVDENVIWTEICPGDGPLGQTTPTAGTYSSRTAFLLGGLAPIGPLFEDGIQLELVDVFVQPSENNDASDRHLTKAVVETKGTGVMTNGKGWSNHTA
ncbi:hypothetical protein FRB96_001991 [Tulasnella sp. 330]|nr:hypothetical protein FRB96_001991 [Tulasnella sp. 330]KAG8872917.1 hypothetical protein FRB97_007257 [Tulasnella sp. 331]